MWIRVPERRAAGKSAWGSGCYARGTDATAVNLCRYYPQLPTWNNRQSRLEADCVDEVHDEHEQNDALQIRERGLAVFSNEGFKSSGKSCSRENARAGLTLLPAVHPPSPLPRLPARCPNSVTPAPSFSRTWRK